MYVESLKQDHRYYRGVKVQSFMKYGTFVLGGFIFECREEDLLA